MTEPTTTTKPSTKSKRSPKRRVKVFKARNSKWMFNITAPNGRILCSSEQYSSQVKCLDVAVSIANDAGYPIEIK